MNQNTSSSDQFKTVKDIENNAKSRMEKVIADLQHEMAQHPHRPRIGQPARQRQDRLLRHADADQPGGHAACAGAVHDHASSLGTHRMIGADREGDPQLRSGPESGQRRQDHPGSDPAADRRAPQRIRQEAPSCRGGAPRRPAQCPPRRERAREEAAEGQADQRRRRSPGARRDPEADRRLHAEARGGREGQRKRHHGSEVSQLLRSSVKGPEVRLGAFLFGLHAPCVTVGCSSQVFLRSPTELLPP